MKYILYARKSSEDDSKQVLSLDSQVSTMQKLAVDLNLNVIKILRESKSAKEPDNRPLFTEMIRMIKRGEVDAILCWHINRLSRNPVDSGTILWLSQQGIIKEIQTSERRYLPDDNALLFSVESGMANQNIRELSKGVKRGMKTKLEKGGYPNYAKIGYVNDKLNKTILVDQERGKYIKRAFELYATGSNSLKAVADIVFKEGFRSRGGYKYNKSKIHKILQDPFYYGVMLVQGKYYNGNHKPIISKELFEKVQDIINGKNRSRYKKHFYPLRGFMTCHKCGCLMTAMEKKGHLYYYCTNGKGNCEEHRRYMRSETAEQELSAIFPNIQFDNDFIELCYQADKEKNQKNESYFETAKSNLEKRLEILAQQQLRLLDIQLAGNYAEDTVSAKITALNKESTEVKQELNNLAKQSPELSLRTLEQTKKVFLTPYSSQKDFIGSDENKKHKALEKLLLNATIENKEMASYKLKQPYQILEKVPDKTDFTQMR
ncbi:MAG: recombinase family protein, partial [Candidatus Moranbacteria bacterium]|nr:recombinase family protein [Candidatus Moranbacteria bacterium]